MVPLSRRVTMPKGQNPWTKCRERNKELKMYVLQTRKSVDPGKVTGLFLKHNVLIEEAIKDSSQRSTPTDVMGMLDRSWLKLALSKTTETERKKFADLVKREEAKRGEKPQTGVFDKCQELNDRWKEEFSTGKRPCPDQAGMERLYERHNKGIAKARQEPEVYHKSVHLCEWLELSWRKFSSGPTGGSGQ